MINENDEFMILLGRAIKYSCDIDKIIKMNKRWKNDYKKQGYIFLKSESIYKEILKLLKNI